MARGKIDPPILDDRTWQDLVNQAVALIPKYAPEWTDHNPSDLGITLIELFAWLVEQMIYRLNRVPEKNYIAFLNLLGITRDPATPASTYVTFRVAGDKAVSVPKGSQVSSQPRTGEEAILFETDQELAVLPANLVTVLYSTKEGFATMTGGLADVVIAPPGDIYLGFDPPAGEAICLQFSFSHPLMKLPEPKMQWSYSSGADTTSWTEFSKEQVDDRTDKFRHDGAVTISVLADWTSHAPMSLINQKLYWIHLKIEANSSLARLGIRYLLSNSVSATNAVTITDETLGSSNGKPFQSFDLKHYPLFKQIGTGDPYDHLVVCVGKSEKPWTCVDEIPQKAETYYRLDPMMGRLYFGDGQNGAIPTEGDVISVKSYRYVAGGAGGNVSASAITVLYSAELKQKGIAAVTNVVAARGGFDEESLEETKRRAPDVLRNRYRAVTLEDYTYLAREASLEVNRARALGPALSKNNEPQSHGGLARDPGCVNLLIIPQLAGADPLANPRPAPEEKLLEEVQDYLDHRRMLATKLIVTGPRYLPINVTLAVKVWQKAVAYGLVADPADQTKFQKWGEQVLGPKIQRYLHPTHGGPDNTGWNFGQDVILPDLAARIQLAVQQDLQIGFVADIKIQAGVPDYDPPTRPFVTEPAGAWVRVADYEIICSGTHTFLGEKADA